LQPKSSTVSHKESGYFKTYIAGQALPLLAKRERAQYALL